MGWHPWDTWGVHHASRPKNSFQNDGELAVADQGAGQLEQAQVDVSAALVAGPESFEGVQPGEAALDHPALLAQAGAVGDAAAGDPWGDPAGAQLAAVDVVVVAAVGEQLARSAAGSAAAAADRRDGVEQRQELGDVVAVAAGEGDRERDAAGVADQVVLGAGTSAVDRGRADVVPPLRARTCEPSTAQQSRSSASRARSCASSCSCRAGQTPASVQSRSRRQQVTPEQPTTDVGS
jgi:hypothetical protein